MLIRESTLRRIIREEARRVLSEDTVGTNLIQKAIEANKTTFTPDGRKVMMPLANLDDPLVTYLNNYNSALKQIEKSINALPKNSPARGSLVGSFNSFMKQGSQSPLASMIVGVQSLNLSPYGKARAILAILAGDRNLDNRWDKSGGATLGIDAPTTLSRPVNESFANPSQFVEQVVAMASFDVVGETKRALAKPGATGQVTGVPEEMEVSSPPVAAPAAAAPRPAMTWDKFVTTVSGGQQIKNAWDRYALASVPPLNVNDYSLFKKWWDGYRKKNPGWAGSPVETVAALGKETAARRAANRAG